jgi:hypothetical protein
MLRNSTVPGVEQFLMLLSYTTGFLTFVLRVVPDLPLPKIVYRKFFTARDLHSVRLACKRHLTGNTFPFHRNMVRSTWASWASRVWTTITTTPRLTRVRKPTESSRTCTFNGSNTSVRTAGPPESLSTANDRIVWGSVVKVARVLGISGYNRAIRILFAFFNIVIIITVKILIRPARTLSWTRLLLCPAFIF